MAQFSGTVKISDLNDFIAPSQACVVSLQGKAPDAKPPAQLLEEVSLLWMNGGEGRYKQLNNVTPSCSLSQCPSCGDQLHSIVAAVLSCNPCVQHACIQQPDHHVAALSLNANMSRTSFGMHMRASMPACFSRMVAQPNTP